MLMNFKRSPLKILLWVGLTFWSGLFCFGQNSIDSLETVLKQSQDPETRTELSLILAKEWIIKHQDSALPYVQDALRLSKEHELEELQIEAENLMGNVLQRQSKPEEALVLYHKAIKKAEALNYQKGLAKLYNNVALIHIERGEFPEALEGFTKATRCEEVIDNPEGKAQGLNNIGVVFYYQGDYDKALEYFLESVKVHESMQNLLSAKQGYNNIGAINEALGRHEQALIYYQRALRIAGDMDDRSELANALNNITSVYSNMENWQASEDYYMQALEVNQKAEDFYSLALVNINLGDLYAKSGQAQKSESYFLKAAQIIEEGQFKNLAYSLYEKMAHYYSEGQNFERAYHYQGLYDQYKDSVYNEAKAKAIAETNALYETEKKEKEAAEAKAALAQEQLTVQRQTQWMILLIAGVVLIIMFGVSMFRQQAIKRRQLETEAALQEERARAEGRRKLEEERNRISRDLHDHIGSQLTIISSQIDNLAFKEASEERRTSFEKISDHTRDTMAQLRETIWAMNNDEINLEMLSAKLQDFMNRSAHEGRSLMVQNHCEPQLVLSPEQTINLFRICQEAVQNAVKYAEFHELKIAFSSDAHSLQVRIEDDGVGMEMDGSVKGYGLQNMQARMQQMKGSFKMESEIGKGTRIYLSLPINTAIAV